MNRLFAYALFGGAVGFGSGLLIANPPVELQPTTPGAAQTGNVNITGKLIAGSVSAASSSPTAQTVVGDATSATGPTFGGVFKTASSGGTGVRGVSTNAISGNGATFQASGVSGAGARGFATSPTGVNFGLYGQSASPEGVGVMGKSTAASGGTGLYGQAPSNGWAGYFAGRIRVTEEVISNLFSGPGSGLTNLNASELISGIVPQARLPFEVARRDQANTFTQPNTFQGQVNIGNSTTMQASTRVGRNSAGAGLYCFNAQAGNLGGSGYVAGSFYVNGSDNYVQGVFANARSAGAGVNVRGGTFSAVYGTTAVGVYGSATQGSTTWAGYFPGNLYATDANSGVKNFLIDHPLDPENRYLAHSSVESDERRNVYWGSVVTDNRGYATVTVPAWFEALNEDVKYQLTVVDETDSADFVLAKVTRRLASGKFTIRTSKPAASVDWQISGKRRDATARFRPLEVEQTKKPHERGRYLDPEAYGYGQEMSVVPPDPSIVATFAKEPARKR